MAITKWNIFHRFILNILFIIPILNFFFINSKFHLLNCVFPTLDLHFFIFQIQNSMLFVEQSLITISINKFSFAIIYRLLIS